MNHGKSFSIQCDVCPRPRKLGGADTETRVGRELRSGSVRLSSYTSQEAKGEREKPVKVEVRAADDCDQRLKQPNRDTFRLSIAKDLIKADIQGCFRHFHTPEFHL